MPSQHGNRPVRTAKQVQPAPGYVDSSTLLFDSEDEGTEGEGEHEGNDEDDDEVPHVPKKLRLTLKGEFKAQANSDPQPPASSCLAYYPETYAAVQKWNRVFGLPAPNPMSDAFNTNIPEPEHNMNQLEGSVSIKDEVSRSPYHIHDRFANENKGSDKKKTGFESLPGELRSKYFPPLRYTLGIAIPSVLATTNLEVLIKEFSPFTMLDFIALVDFCQNKGLFKWYRFR